MRFLILVNHDVVIYNFRRELLERLIVDGHEIYISSVYGERIELLKKMGCKYIDTKISRHGTNPVEDYGLLRFYKKIMREIKPDYALTYTIKPNIYGGMAAADLNIPYMANITGLGTALENEGMLQKFVIGLYKRAFRKIQCVFIQNEENKKFFVDHNLFVNKLKLLPGSGVNLNQFKLLPYPDDETVEFLFLARIMKEKGIEQYIEASKEIRKKYPNTKFHICGFCEEDYKDRVQELTNNGDVIYHGMISDVREMIKITHCTVHPSYYPEGLSNVLLESAACGRPIITTRRAGCQEVVDEGKNGYLVDCQSTEQLIEAIHRFMKLTNEERKQMGLAGRNKVKKEFDRQIVVDAYLRKINY